MKFALIIKLIDNKYIIINEEAVSSIKQLENGAAELRMINGDEWICVDPPYHAWENDALRRKT